MADYTSQTVCKAGEWSDAFDSCVLTYANRFLRRKVIATKAGQSILLDLAHTTSLDHGDALKLDDGRFIEIVAAQESLLEIKGDLTRLAWHIGNRHMPCQIQEHRIVIQQDHVMRDMLEKLGANLKDISEPFTPEGGAYGHGRTHGHQH